MNQKYKLAYNEMKYAPLRYAYINVCTLISTPEKKDHRVADGKIFAKHDYLQVKRV